MKEFSGGKIEIRNLSKAFDGVPVLRNFSCEFPKGEISSLMAPSGAGKTTLLRIMAGLDEADSGEILGMDGLTIGMVFQEDRLVEHLDGADNLRLVNGNLSKEEAESQLKKLGIDEPSGKPVSEYSGGMKRRVALLRSLCLNDQVILMDEPLKGLDEETKKTAIEYIKGVWMELKPTIILVTHDPEEVKALGCAPSDSVFL